MKGYLPVAVSALQPETRIQFTINLNFAFFFSGFIDNFIWDFRHQGSY